MSTIAEKNHTPLVQKTRQEISFRSTKYGGEQLLMLD